MDRCYLTASDLEPRDTILCVAYLALLLIFAQLLSFGVRVLEIERMGCMYIRLDPSLIHSANGGGQPSPIHFIDLQ